MVRPQCSPSRFTLPLGGSVVTSERPGRGLVETNSPLSEGLCQPFDSP